MERGLDPRPDSRTIQDGSTVRNGASIQQKDFRMKKTHPKNWTLIEFMKVLDSTVRRLDKYKLTDSERTVLWWASRRFVDHMIVTPPAVGEATFMRHVDKALEILNRRRVGKRDATILVRDLIQLQVYAHYHEKNRGK